MQQPSVTVGMPVYNDPDGLRRSVPTVFGQTWKGPIRLVVIDDGSTDETPEVLESLAATYRNIEIVRNATNRGRPFGRNQIIEHAGDDYLAWIDAGDLWHPRKLELQWTALLAAEAADPHTPLLCTGPIRWQFDDRAGPRIRYSELEGDQLRNALTGKLLPYLQAIMGRADHFRRFGGFDPQLVRRQDYDFLVRFVGGGGRVIGTHEDVPLFTYLKSYVGGSAEAVAASNAVIRRKHQEFYRRYGWRLERQIRANQHRLVARFYRSNGKALLSAAYRVYAALADLEPVPGARRAIGVVWPPGRLLGRALRLFLRAIAPWVRRPEVVALARKVGLLRLLAATGIMRRVYRPLKSEVEQAGRFSARPATVPGELPSGITEVEQRVAAAEDVPEPQVWLRLEKAYRDVGLLHSAESALQRGLERHPESPELRVRLIELLSLRRKWADCVAAWEKGEPLPAEELRDLTYTRVARSYRRLEDHARARAVAEQGLRRWPDDPRLWDELSMSRAELVDWPRSLVPTSPVAEDARGAVTDLGFLAGGDGPIVGRVAARDVGVAPVTLEVNGAPMATTYAAPGTDDRRWLAFALSCHDLRLYLGDGDVVSVTCEGQTLTMDGYGAGCEIATGHPSRFAELHQAVKGGKVFTKFGVLRTGNTKDHKKHTLELFDAVADVLATAHGYTAYPFYGNLLGAIREHDFIGHDVGGFDMGYISRLQTADEVRAEFLAICRTLLERGYFLRVEPWSTYVRSTRNSPVFVDLNYAWFTHRGELNLSFGWRAAPVTDSERCRQPRKSPIAGHLVDVPGNAEDVLEQIYGDSWAIPDQGFTLETELERDWSYLLTVPEMTSLTHIDPDRAQVILDEHPEGAQ